MIYDLHQTMCFEAELTVESRPEGIRIGRQFVAAALARWGVDESDPACDRVDEIMLVTSELLTNAVHASLESAELRIEAHRDHVLVTVRDDSTAPATIREAGHGDTGGRGLAIVDALSEGWGSTPVDGSGKVVWSRLAIPERSALSARCVL